jgi:hypothetical protein
MPTQRTQALTDNRGLLLCPICRRRIVGWPYQRSAHCSPKGWVNCIGEPQNVYTPDVLSSFGDTGQGWIKLSAPTANQTVVEEKKPGKRLSEFRLNESRLLNEIKPAYRYIRSTDKIPPLYSQDGKGDNAVAFVKIFNPTGDQTWFITEYDPTEDRAFGLVYMHGESELGYIDMNELRRVRGQFGLPLERDIHFRKMTLGQIRAKRGNV